MSKVETSNQMDNNKTVTSKFELIALLFSRIILFAVFQTIISIFCNSWHESERYWMLVATLGNVVSIYLLAVLFKREGKKYLHIFRFNKQNWKKDARLFCFLFLVLIPIALVPNYFLSLWFWGDPNIPFRILFQPISNYWAYFLIISFPVTIAFAELATYFGYIMPRLENVLGKTWLAVLLPVLFLSLQHCCLPLVFDTKFILYRGLMYLPFALFIGIALRKRPRLLPYFVILHGLMDMQAVLMLF
jgi:hypothetical protein